MPGNNKNKERIVMIGADVLSNWNQNDPSSPDHIKNRTHYIDDDGNVHKLDAIFLPDSIATKADILGAMEASY